MQNLPEKLTTEGVEVVKATISFIGPSGGRVSSDLLARVSALGRPLIKPPIELEVEAANGEKLKAVIAADDSGKLTLRLVLE
jgi:hypothetical protein